MRDLISAIVTTTYALCFAVKARDLMRDPTDPILRWICITLGCTTLTGAAGVPSVQRFLESWSGVLAIWTLVPAFGGVAGTRATLIMWVHPSLSEARRKIRRGIVIYGVGTALAIALTVSSRGRVPQRDLLVGSASMPQWTRDNEAAFGPWAATPYVRDAVLIFLVMTCVTYVTSAAYLRQATRAVDRRWLRRGIRALLVAWILMIVYSIGGIVYFAGYWLGVALPNVFDYALLAVSISSIASASGFLLPAIGPRLDRMVAYRRLGPLWSALRRAIPEVVLDEPAIAAGWNPLKADFRLYRRVIEIRDGMLAVRHYLDDDIATTAERMGRAAQQSASEIEVTVAAAQLAAAIRDKQFARPYARDTSDVPPPLLVRGGNDLDSELRILLPLAQAFATSEIVRAAAQRGIESGRHVPSASAP